MTEIVKFSLWTDEELIEALKAIEQALLTGATQVTFLGQTVIYSNDSAKRKTIDELTRALCDRKVLPESATRKRTKRIRVKTDNTGF
jgi:hypothetical protein